jgi:hypothetical protein
MNTLIDKAVKVSFIDRHIVIRMESNAEFSFPIASNPRLAKGNISQIQNVEISPFGIHCPDLDEDLSFRGLVDGDYGQHQRA